MSARRRPLPDENRRGWCPGLTRPMPTGDGLLARVHPPLGIVSLSQIKVLAEGARRFGNGHIDLTARANLQIRGVRNDTAGPLAALLTQAGLGDARRDGGPQRITLTSPLADPGILALARAIEAQALAIAELPAKTLVVIEGAGTEETEADIRLWPSADGSVQFALGGDVAAALALPQDRSVAAVAAMLAAFAATGDRRIRDLPEAERNGLRQTAIRAAHPPSPRARGEGRDDLVVGAASPKGEGEGAWPEKAFPGMPPHLRLPPRFSDDEVGKTLSPRAGRGDAHAVTVCLSPGLFDLSDRTILVLDAPFGRCSAIMLDNLSNEADELGCTEIRLTPSRGVLLAARDADAAASALDRLTETGFVTAPGDPRRAVAACPGAPACASGSTPVADHAARLAQAFAPFAARGRSAHVSGCAKGCAHPTAADLTLVAAQGRYGVLLGQSADGEPATVLPFEAVLERVSRADPSRPLDEAFRTKEA